MAYRIAVATTDGIQIDTSFGAATEFLIFEINETEVHILETRKVKNAANSLEGKEPACSTHSCTGGGCGSHRGCGGKGHLEKIALVEDCRCLLCEKVGGHALRELDQRAISTFAIRGRIEDVFDKLIPYFDKIDHHQSLRKIV